MTQMKFQWEKLKQNLSSQNAISPFEVIKPNGWKSKCQILRSMYINCSYDPCIFMAKVNDSPLSEEKGLLHICMLLAA